MLNNVKTGFCFLLFLIHFIFFHFKLLNFDFKSSHSSFYVTIVCLICVFLHKKKFQSAFSRLNSQDFGFVYSI